MQDVDQAIKILAKSDNLTTVAQRSQLRQSFNSIDPLGTRVKCDQICSFAQNLTIMIVWTTRPVLLLTYLKPFPDEFVFAPITD